VVGGGFSAIKSALQLSQVGLRATLLDKEVVLGTGTDELESFYGFDISSVIRCGRQDESIEVFTSAQLTADRGENRGFHRRITKEGEEIFRRYGAIVLATGYQTELAADYELKLRAEGEASCGTNIVSQEQFVHMLRNQSLETRPKTIGFMFDFTDENSRFPTLATLITLWQPSRSGASEVYVFCKSVKVDSEGMESVYREARDCGVVFVKSDVPPRITVDNGRVQIEAKIFFWGKI
jgi:hypothetical protein